MWRAAQQPVRERRVVPFVVSLGAHLADSVPFVSLWHRFFLGRGSPEIFRRDDWRVGRGELWDRTAVCETLLESTIFVWAHLLHIRWLSLLLQLLPPRNASVMPL